MKKLMLLVMAFTVFFAFSGHDTADAAKRGGFKAPKKSFTTTPTKPADGADNVKRTDGAAAKPAAGAATTKPGLGGGGFLKGMMVGGLAGMLFGSMFAGMGAFGNMLGFLVNVLAIIALIMVVRAVIGHFRARKRLDDNRRPY